MIRRTVATLLLSSLAGLALANGTSRIQADKMVFKQNQGITVFTGHVHYSEPQQSISIHADQVTIYSQHHKVVRVEASGDPVRFSHKSRTKPVQGQAQRLEYLASADTVTLNGAAQVKTDKGLIRGEHIKYDIATQQAVASGNGKANGRFEAVITPGQTSNGDGQSK